VKTAASLEAIFKAVEGRVSPQKLRQVRRHLVAVLGSEGLARPVDDPMILRRQLIAQLRRAAVSAGTVEALIQFYMGIVRRAALAGLIPPPPEGPWTRVWQSVLDLAEGLSGKAQVRSLAAWATEKGIEPHTLRRTHFKKWTEDVKLGESAIMAAREVLERWVRQPTPPAVASDAIRAERLRRKAAHGSVSAV
jgi:hypothetical protein